MAALRHPESGVYSHASLASVRAADADRTLRQSHYQLFSEWLGYSLEEQNEDLRAFLTQSQTPPESFRFRDLIPANAREVEKQLYITDLETLLELLSLSLGDVSRYPGA